MFKNIYTRCSCLLKRKKYKKGVIYMQITKVICPTDKYYKAGGTIV